MSHSSLSVPVELSNFVETSRERDIIAAVIATGAIRTAATQLSLARSTVRDVYKRVEQRCINAGGHSSLVKVPIPLSMRMSKTTVHVHSEKGIIEEWRRLHPDVAEFEAWAQEFADQVRGTAPKIPVCRKLPKENILRTWMLSDHHLGMRAWGKETNDDDYDTKAGLNLLKRAAEYCLPAPGEVQKILIASLGDFWHADSRTPVTERSGNILDVDSRWMHTLQLGVLAFRSIIEEAARRAPEVEVVFVPGNHDYHTSCAASMILAAAYEKSPQIHIVVPTSNIIPVVHGKTFLVFTHGDRIQARRLQSVVSADFPELWGQTKYRYGHCGHIHQTRQGGTYLATRDESEGLLVENHPILPPRDAYAAGEGYRAQRATEVVDYHSEFGEIRRLRVPVAMLQVSDRTEILSKVPTTKSPRH